MINTLSCRHQDGKSLQVRVTAVRKQGSGGIFLVLDVIAPKAGRLDFAFADGVAIAYGLLRRPGGNAFAFHGPNFDEPKWFGHGVGVGLRKADAATLGKAFNGAIATLRASGEYKALQDRYFDFDIYGN